MSSLLPKETLYPWPPKETPYLCLPTSTTQPYKNHIFYLLSFQDCSVSGIGSLIPEQLNNHASIMSPSSLPPITQSENPIVKMVVKRGIKVHVFHSLKFKRFGKYTITRPSHEITEAIETKITQAVRLCPQIPVNTLKVEGSWKVSIQHHYFSPFLNIPSRMASFH